MELAAGLNQAKFGSAELACRVFPDTSFCFGLLMVASEAHVREQGSPLTPLLLARLI